jgi:hypothetical protein
MKEVILLETPKGSFGKDAIRSPIRHGTAMIEANSTSSGRKLCLLPIYSFPHGLFVTFVKVRFFFDPKQVFCVDRQFKLKLDLEVKRLWCLSSAPQAHRL